jgi:hypothetical protein
VPCLEALGLYIFFQYYQVDSHVDLSSSNIPDVMIVQRTAPLYIHLDDAQLLGSIRRIIEKSVMYRVQLWYP